MNIISDLYETKISADNSEVLLNDTITITVKLIDFNGMAVNRNNVTIIVLIFFKLKYRAFRI